MILFQLLLGLTVGAIVLYVVKVVLARQRYPGPLPPGPKPIPILGNISDLPPPNTPDWVHWLKHKEVYGPVSSVTVMGQTLVIVNDIDAATELLVKRSSKYSSRPNMVFASELVGFEHTLGMQKYSSRLRSYRKAIHQHIGTEPAVAKFKSLQEVEARRLLLRILQEPTGFVEHLQTEAGAIILKMAYGYNIQRQEPDSLVRISNVALDQFLQCVEPGAWLVDIIPSLTYVPSWFPGAGFKRTAQAWKKHLESVVNIPYAFARRQIEEGSHQPSYLSEILKATDYPSQGSEDEMVAKWTAASLYIGGADTTVCAMEIFFLAMTLYPEVQQKAQEEIDQVLGPCQLPTSADRYRLPYIDALVKEVLRWRPVAPMGLPHASTEDDTWEGYFIPKGSLILPNVRAMTHDPAVYHDPMAFKPERFLPMDGREPELNPHAMVFGFGRRICPARILADTTIYLNAAQCLASFDIRKALENGEEVDVQPEFQTKGISHPLPWKFSIEPRSEAHAALIRSVEYEHPLERSNADDLPDIEL